MPKAVGIDLGTTNSVIAVVEGDEPVIIQNAEGERITPSVVAFSKDGQILVGRSAKRQAILNPERTIVSVKRKMGTRHRFVIDGKEYSPEQISAFILQKLKRDAESYLGEPVKQAVITVPARFDHAQRTATKDAGTIAGLEVLRIINEPTAAAMAYGFGKGKEGLVLVWDLGGGTFDVSILEIGEGVYEVKATAGNTQLGGDDFDQRLIDYVAEEFKKEHGIDLREDRQALQRLKEACEKAKCELSTLTETTISLPFITADETGPKHLEMTITRAKFQELTRDLVEMCRGPFEQAIKDAKISPKDLDEVILVGGATRMPAIQDLVRELTGKEPRRDINPDEVVAMGAAIQAAILTGEMKEVVLVDVVPLSLGIETLGGVFTKIIERNTPIPVRRSELFTTVVDGQTTVAIKVYQGERTMAQDNKFLGEFHLTGIPPAPRGVPQIEVTFDIDANGILHVSARDKATGREQSITITGSSNLSKEEIERMIEEAKRHEEEDRRRREEAERRNKAEMFAYDVEKALRDAGDKLPTAEKEEVERALRELRKKLEEKASLSEIERAEEELRQKSYRLFEILYRQAASSGSGPSGQQQSKGPESQQDKGGGENVIDADYKAEDEK